MKKIDWNVWKPRLAYGAFVAVAFVLSLRWTFPAEAVKERLIMEASARGWSVDAQEVSPGGLLGVRARGVRLENHAEVSVAIEEVRASLQLLPLLIGRRVLDFDARLWDGRISGSAGLSGDSRRLAFEARDVDLGRAVPLRRAAGLELVGKLGGTVDLVLPATPDGKPAGRVDLSVTGAGISGGQVPLPAMGSSLPLPKMALGTLTAAVKLDQGKASFEKLEAKGGEAELTTEGMYVVLQPKLEYAPLSGRAKLRIQDVFWTKPATQGFKGIAEMALAPSRGADGAYQLQLYGSLGHPQARPVGVGQ